MSELKHALHNGAAFVRRSEGGMLLLSDADRADFLQRMTTNNIAALHPGQAAVTVLTSPTARVVQVFSVLCRAADLVLLPSPGQTAALARHLRGQIFFMDKIKVTDRTPDHARLRVMGPHAAQAVRALGFDLEGAERTFQELDGVVALAQPEYDVPGIELTLPVTALDAALTALTEAGVVEVDEITYQARRIELGRPAPGFELTGDVNPLEAGLAWACPNGKGCYTGQEIIARQITYDKVTKTLVGLHADSLLTAGTPLFADGREAGSVTSSAFSSTTGMPIALGIVKRPHNQPGAILRAAETPVTVVALPFALPFTH